MLNLKYFKKIKKICKINSSKITFNKRVVIIIITINNKILQVKLKVWRKILIKIFLINKDNLKLK